MSGAYTVRPIAKQRNVIGLAVSAVTGCKVILSISIVDTVVVTTAATESAKELPPWLTRYARGDAMSPFIVLAHEFVAALEQGDGTKQATKLIAAVNTLQVLAEIEVDIDSVSAMMVSVLPGWDTQRVASELGTGIASLVDGLKRLRAIESLSAESTSTGAQQLESLRKMLLAMAQDMRVVLIKLAEQVGVMRALTKAAPHLQRQAATHTLNLYTPLANRLGVWQLKWELEDLAFRFLEPQTYQDIARLVDERRVDRETLYRASIDAVASGVTHRAAKGRSARATETHL